MPESVYILCASASTACAVLLYATYRSIRTPLLFWSSICFAGLAVNNALLFVDLIIVPDVDLSILRAGIALAACSALLFGLIWNRN